MKHTVWPILFLFFFNSSCQVKEQVTPSGDIIAGHKSYSNAFTILPPIPATYYTGDTINFSISFPVTVTVDSTGGVPYLMIDIGGNLVSAQYVTGDGTTELQFEYIVISSDTDSNGIDVFSLALSGAVLTYNVGAAVKSCNSTITSKHFSDALVN